MLTFFERIIPNVIDKLPDFIQSIIDTFIMLGIAGAVSLIFGILFGVILIVTREHDILENKSINFILGKVMDLFRSIPFIILVVFLDPLTRLIMGTGIGIKGSLVPLIIGTIPFFARQVESALAEIDRGLIEASTAMGSTPLEIIFRVYLKESVPGIIRASSITLISLLGFITMVGAIAGGGVGDFAIRYGHNSMQSDVTFVCVIVLLIITSIIQGIGTLLIKKTTH